MVEESGNLEKRHIAATSWFNIIAVLSLLNTIIVFLKWEIMFPVGLGTSFIGALLFAEAPIDPTIDAQILRFMGLLFMFISLIIIGLFFLFRVKAKQGKIWAYIAGMIIYFLDALICVGFQDWISAGFHAWGLFSIWGGYTALKQLIKINDLKKNELLESEPIFETQEKLL